MTLVRFAIQLVLELNLCITPYTLPPLTNLSNASQGMAATHVFFPWSLTHVHCNAALSKSPSGSVRCVSSFDSSANPGSLGPLGFFAFDTGASGLSSEILGATHQRYVVDC